MSVGKLIELYNLMWMFDSHHHQRLAWEDAANARQARDRAERMAAEQFAAMLAAHPSGALGWSALNDRAKLEESGLL